MSGGDAPAATAAGRAALAAWLDDQPRNYYRATPGLRRGLLRHLGERGLARLEPQLDGFGAAMAAIDAAVRENNEGANLPRLRSHDGIGQRIDEVVHHPSYHEAGRAIYGGGVMSAWADKRAPNMLALSLFYLSSFNGEAGHNCPLACTAGLIKVLQRVASPALRERWLSGLLDTDYGRRLHAAQFLTELQGGSDVGANGTRAEPDPEEPGRFRIYGEKWFCSNVDADVALITARRLDGAGGARPGTAGLGLFAVPLQDPRGGRNGHRVWRLKDKLGTRSMASGEITFDGAAAWHVGPPEEGFANIMRWVIHTSRIYNAFSVGGAMMRAWLVASGYARHRVAFGQPIAAYPMVQETLAAMRSDAEAVRACGQWLLARQDRLEAGAADDAVAAAQRLCVNLNKSVSARLAHEVINQGIEVLGGNGAIESFSVLPRLLRDNVVAENWEGTHNTLVLQWLRDATGRRMGAPFCDELEALFEGVGEAAGPALGALRAEGLEGVAALREAIGDLGALEPGAATLVARRVSDRAAMLLYGGCLLDEAAFAVAQLPDEADEAVDLTWHFWARRVRRTPAPIDDTWLARIARLSA